MKKAFINRDMEVSFVLPRAKRGWKKYFKTKVTFRFDMLAWLKCCEVNGVEIWQINELQQEELLHGVCYGAAVSSCMLEYKRPFFNYDLVRYWLLNVLTNAQAVEILRVMETSRAFNSPQKVATQEGGDEKK